jgi:hypothetical protein
MNSIVAGIINTITGEILDTVTNPSQKTSLRLKARDELNIGNDKDTFMVFEFNSLNNIVYIKKNMKADEPKAVLELDRLHCLYTTEVSENNHSRMLNSLEMANETRDECENLFKANPFKLNFVLDAIDNEIENITDEISDVKSTIFNLNRRLEGICKKIELELE